MQAHTCTHIHAQRNVMQSTRQMNGNFPYLDKETLGIHHALDMVPTQQQEYTEDEVVGDDEEARDIPRTPLFSPP